MRWANGKVARRTTALRGAAVTLALAAALTLAGGPGTGAALAAPGGMKAASSTDVAADAAEPVIDAQPEYPGELGADLGFLPSDIDTSKSRRVTISRLASVDDALDGQLVTFSGEVVGEPVRLLDGNRWVQMQSAGSGSYIMVVMTDDQASLIERYGGYQSKGTTLRVTGVYRVADPNQLGDTDVTAYEVTLSDEGERRVEPVKYRMLWCALAFVAAGAVLLVVERIRRRRTS